MTGYQDISMGIYIRIECHTNKVLHIGQYITGFIKMTFDCHDGHGMFLQNSAYSSMGQIDVLTLRHNTLYANCIVVPSE